MTLEPTEALIARINATRPASAPPVGYKTISLGAARSVLAGGVAEADAVGGRYCEDCHVAEIVESARFRGGVWLYALDAEHARALWAKSEDMVGERF